MTPFSTINTLVSQQTQQCFCLSSRMRPMPMMTPSSRRMNLPSPGTRSKGATYMGRSKSRSTVAHCPPRAILRANSPADPLGLSGHDDPVGVGECEEVLDGGGDGASGDVEHDGESLHEGFLPESRRTAPPPRDRSRAHARPRGRRGGRRSRRRRGDFPCCVRSLYQPYASASVSFSSSSTQLSPAHAARVFSPSTRISLQKRPTPPLRTPHTSRAGNDANRSRGERNPRSTRAATHCP